MLTDLATLEDETDIETGRTDLTELVHGRGDVNVPVQRWYSYKEAFATGLPGVVVDEVGAGIKGVVADVFAGVATTQLGLRSDHRVTRILGVEYSPFAHFVGQTKLASLALRPALLESLARTLASKELDGTQASPALSTFSDSRAFDVGVPGRLADLKCRIASLEAPIEARNFFLLGLASAIEMVSNTIKDGRALRIVGPGHSRRQMFRPSVPDWCTSTDPVMRTAVAMWSAMIDDIATVQAHGGGHSAVVMHVRGDARRLDLLLDDESLALFPDESVGLFLSSPPYLNSLDYTEVYKLELWLLEFVQTQADFREVRLGTLRSHPSIGFPNRGYPPELEGSRVMDLVQRTSSFLAANLPRASTGVMVRQYFEDMANVLRQQHQASERGGHNVMVVANSTLARRRSVSNGATKRERHDEDWRLSLPTDVILAQLALALGYRDVRVLRVRKLRPRNVAAGLAWESIVLMRKPGLA